jgi:hypothetical protein
MRDDDALVVLRWADWVTLQPPSTGEGANHGT